MSRPGLRAFYFGNAGAISQPDFGDWLDRTTLKPVDTGAVRQIIEISSDNGKPWKTTFDAIYRRDSAN